MSSKYPAKDLISQNKDNPLIAHIDTAKYLKPASDDAFKRTVEGLEKRGFAVHVVNNKKEALQKLKDLAPAGVSVSNGFSTGLEEVGFMDVLKTNTTWKNYHGLLLAEKDPAKAAELRRQGYSADYFFASPNAISTSGILVAADLTGTKTGGFIEVSRNLVLLAGSNKIVEGGLTEALERLEKFALPMESLRAHLVYGVPASAANHIVVLQGANPWGATKRVHVVLCKEILGY